MRGLTAKISTGKLKGNRLYPHKNENEQYVASSPGCKIDYIFVDKEEELKAFVKSGLGTRMSNPAINYSSTSLKTSKNINLSNDIKKGTFILKIKLLAL